MNDDEIVGALRRAAASGARPVAIAERLGEMIGGLTFDAFVLHMRRAFPGIPDDVLFDRAAAWPRLGPVQARFIGSDQDIDAALGRWIAGVPQMDVLQLQVRSAENSGHGELLDDGRFRVLSPSGYGDGGKEFKLIVADGITFAVFECEHVSSTRPRWLDACVFITNLRESDTSVTFDVRVDGDVTKALASFAAATSLVTSGHRIHDPMIAKDSAGRAYWVHLGEPADVELGWSGSVEVEGP